MNYLLLSAAVLTFLLGLVHSILGERQLFSHLREGKTTPTQNKPPLKSSHIRIIWATWHLATIFGWGMASVIFISAVDNSLREPQVMTLNFISAAMLVGGLIVLYATRGRHPGWVVLMTIAVLIWLGCQ